MGIDQIGAIYLKNPYEMKITVGDEVKLGDIFVIFSTDSGNVELRSICSGKIKNINEDALKHVRNESYTKGYLIEFSEIEEIKPDLITDIEIRRWAIEEVRPLLNATYSYKVIAVGDSAVGKTAIKVRFTDDYFKKNLKTTIGVDFGAKELKLEYVTDDPTFIGPQHFTAKMNVWDAAGQSYFDKFRGMYYRDAKGVLIVYDINNYETFTHLEKWIDELDTNLGLNKVPVLLIGNKCDLERKVPIEEVEAIAKEYGFISIVTSAKNGDNIEKAFQTLAIEIYKKEEFYPI